MVIYALILNWNGFSDTLACLKSVEKLNVTGINLNVVVIDNASHDESDRKLKSIKLPNATYELVVNKSNLGYAGGMNVGITYALEKNADYVLLLNNDVLLSEDLVVELVAAALKNKKAGIVVPKIYFAKGYEFHKKRYKENDLGRVIWYAGGVLDWKNVYGINRGVDEVDKGQHDALSLTDFATGNCMLINLKALSKVGKFNEDYYMYLEDVELSIRLRKKGWDVIYAPKAVLWHKVAQSSAIGGGLNDYFITRNRLLFGLRYAPMRARIALLKESQKLLFSGREWQRKGVRDFYLGKFGKGSWK
jgi:hypothetical protein